MQSGQIGKVGNLRLKSKEELYGKMINLWGMNHIITESMSQLNLGL